VRQARSRRTVFWVALAVAGVVAALVGVLVTRPAAQSASAQSPLLGKAAPELEGVSPLTGSSVSLAGLRGRFVLVNFFASWCVPCRTEEPELVQLDYQHKAANDLAIVGVAFDDTTSGARQFLRSYGAVWPAVQDPDGGVALRYGVRGPPESFLVAPDGKLVAKFAGPLTAAGVDHYLAAAKAEQA